jgi:polyferredoxin
VKLVQNRIFIALFAVLVIALPLLTKKRTQCAFFCPFEAFQSIFNKTSVFDVNIDRTRCTAQPLGASVLDSMYGSLGQALVARQTAGWGYSQPPIRQEYS